MGRFARGGLVWGSTGILGQRGVVSTLLRYWHFLKLVKHFFGSEKIKLNF